MAEQECEPRSCREGGKALLLPLFPGENSSSTALRTLAYSVLLLWCFLGIGVVSDIFMNAIEKITSKRRRLMDPGTMAWRTVKVWNDTVANLTLMALGSSAPEILLSIIETLGNGYEAGSLGPSTIVGSAAFNLLMITAVCVSVIPPGEVRAIEDTQVFLVTAAFSIFAYLWLLVIVSCVSADVVHSWESGVTLLLFPILVTVSWIVDKGYLSFRRSAKVAAPSIEDMRRQEFANLEMLVLQQFASKSSLPDEDILKLVESEYGHKSSRATYRKGATHKLVSGGFREERTASKRGTTTSKVSFESGPSKCSVEFASSTYSVLQRAGSVDLVIRRMGRWPGFPVRVRYSTCDDTAIAGQDYTASQGDVVFEKETDVDAGISIEVGQGGGADKRKMFCVELLEVGRALGNRVAARGAFNNPSCQRSRSLESLEEAQSSDAALLEMGHRRKAFVRILDDDFPGTLKFVSDTLEIRETDTYFDQTVVVMRVGGCRGEVSCKYRTEDHTAISGVDYVATSGELVFKDRQEIQQLTLTVKSRNRFGTSHAFRLILDDPQGGVDFCSFTDGGESSAICTVNLISGMRSQDRLNRVWNRLQLVSETSRISHQKYWQQFVRAFQVREGTEDETNGETQDDDEPLALYEWSVHVVMFFWKFVFAFIPPPGYCGGWLCFIVSLAMIGVLTAVVGDLASLLGCCLEIPDSITAITFVALGTSLPDTFASRAAAIQDPTADASVGNVTGSNSVNVFLGLGLPWLLSSIHWERQGLEFVVVGGNLVFSVGVFSGCAAACFVVLLLRRGHPAIKAELGGPVVYKYITSIFLVFLWLAYVGMSSWEALANRGPCD